MCLPILAKLNDHLLPLRNNLDSLLSNKLKLLFQRSRKPHQVLLLLDFCSHVITASHFLTNGFGADLSILLALDDTQMLVVIAQLLGMLLNFRSKLVERLYEVVDCFTDANLLEVLHSNRQLLY